jgi:hypothetical protein
MVKPQQPELARSRKGQTDRDGKELRVNDDKSLEPPEDGLAPVPEANTPGHKPEQEQDKPQGPPGQ